MIKIAFIQQKGGAGKTTMCIHAACALAESHKVALVDLDTQGSIAAWYEHISAQPKKLDIFSGAKAKDLGLLSGYDYVIVDTKGELSAEVLPFVDVALLPCQPSPLDVWAAADSVQLCRDYIAKINPKLKAALVVSRLLPNTLLGKEIKELLLGYELPVLKAVLRQRTGYAASIALGKSAVSSGVAEVAEEARAFAKAIKEFSKGSK